MVQVQSYFGALAFADAYDTKAIGFDWSVVLDFDVPSIDCFDGFDPIVRVVAYLVLQHFMSQCC